MTHSPRFTLSARVVGMRLIQWFIAIVLAATCLGKALDVSGFMNVIGTYEVFPAFLYPIVAVAMIVIEGMLSLWLFSGRELHKAALASAFLHLSFTLFAITALLRGLSIPNCGCFGVFYARPLTWKGTVVEDIVMIVLSLILYALSRRKNVQTSASRSD